MDWPLAISRNRDALRRIVTALFAMMGGRAAAKLPRHVYAAVLMVLRPAESAVRRLIVIAAHGLALKPRAARPLPAGLAGFGTADASKTPLFCLFDPLKHFSLDDYDNKALPRSGFASLCDEDFSTPQFLSPDEQVDSTLLFCRLRALRHALNHLSRQARRLIRWQARRDLLLNTNVPFKPMRVSTFRPGLPPGWRGRRIHEIDDLLRECHGLALDRMNAPNTS